MDRLGFLYIVLFMCAAFCALPLISRAQVMVNWTGGTSGDWNTASNWSTGAVPGTADSVQIGAIAYSRQPVINNNVSVAFMQFTGTGDTLTVNSGDTLRVGGSIIQGHLAYNVAPNTVLQGGGAVYCTSFVVGNGVLPKVVILKSSLFESKVASLNISGNLTVRSYTTDLLSGAIAHNNGVFSLEDGQLNLSGQIYLDNFWPAYLTSMPGTKPLAKFMININSNNNATLVLSDTTAVATMHAGCDTVDFYHYTSGTGISIVKYTGSNQLLYTNNTPGLDTLPNTYQNLYIEGSRAKTAGNSSSGNNLSTAGDLIVNSGTLDLESFSAACTVNGNFINRDTVNVGSPGITFKGPTFINDKVFNHDNAWVTFSGGSQALTDSTSGGTSLRFVAFADTGTKSIYHGTFAIIPSGKVKLLNNVTVQVDTATFILQSDTTGTAAITAIPTGSVIKGNVNAQWFVAGSPTSTQMRTYRMISSPVNHTGTTNGTGDYNPNWIKGTTLYDGAFITGLDSTINGFDYGVNPTLYLYREDVNYNGGSFTAGNYRGINKINDATSINNVWTQKRFTTTETADTIVRVHIGNGVFFFFRGNRVLSNGTTSGTKIHTPYNYPENVTFTNKGRVNQGQVQVRLFFRNDNYLSYTDSAYIINGPARGYNMVGNPYPSAINWDNFSATDSTAAIYGPGLKDTAEIYDPASHNFYKYGANPAHNRDSVYYGAGTATNIIASGQGFFVQVDSTSANRLTASLRFREPAKFNPPSTMGSGGMMMMALHEKTPVVGRIANTVKTAKKPPGPVSTTRPVGNAVLQLKLFAANKVNDDASIVLSPRRVSHKAHGNLPEPDASGRAITFGSHLAGTEKLKVNTVTLPFKSTEILLFVDPAQSGSYSLGLGGTGTLPIAYSLKVKDRLTGSVIDARKQAKYSFKVDKAHPKSYGDRLVLMITKIKPGN